MVCGSKRYDAQVEMEGQIYVETVTARTPAEARKALRRKYGKSAHIITVRECKGPGKLHLV